MRIKSTLAEDRLSALNSDNVIALRESLRKLNPKAIQIEAASPLFVEGPEAIRGKRVLVIEDGPTLTHGEMAYGAGFVAARRFGAKESVDPRRSRSSSLRRLMRSIRRRVPSCPLWATAQSRLDCPYLESSTVFPAAKSRSRVQGRAAPRRHPPQYPRRSATARPRGWQARSGRQAFGSARSGKSRR